MKDASGNETVLYLLSDHLGSVNVIADGNGGKYPLSGVLRCAPRGETRYAAFGETRYEAGSLPTGYRYTGQRRELSGLDYFQARWFDKYFQDSREVLDGTFIGAGGAVPGVGVYGSLSYSLEVLRVDQAGSQWWLHQPSIGEVLSDLGEVIQHDILNVH